MSNVLDKFKVDPNATRESIAWYREQVAKMMGKVTPNVLLKDKNLTKKTAIIPGQLYFFYYDPKFKDKLPYYDRFPMVFPFRAVPGGFLGLNLHYLGYKERFALFNKLLEVNGKTIDNTTKLRMTWSMINAFSNLRGIDNCVKHYLYDHVRSPFMKVQPEDWTTSMLLPVEQFVGAKKEYVWNESKRK